MVQFYFNDCFPDNTVSQHKLLDLFSQTIQEFVTLVRKGIGIDKAIILEKNVSDVVFKDKGITLKDLISQIPTREIRVLAFSYFTKFPIHKFLDSQKIEDRLLKEEYKWEGLDAINLAIAQHHACILFSIAIHESLAKDSLRIEGNNDSFKINNLYGNSNNTNYIESEIRKLNAASLTAFEQLKVELGTPIYSSAFGKEFISQGQDVQMSIIEKFKEAKGQNLFNFPNDKLVKDVTPDNKKELKGKVLELRIYSPIALRIYFCEYQEKIFIAKIGFKADKDQSSDIVSSIKVISSMIKTSS